VLSVWHAAWLAFALTLMVMAWWLGFASLFVPVFDSIHALRDIFKVVSHHTDVVW
jgi:hypothetical protein